MVVPLAWRMLIALAVMALLTPLTARAADPPHWQPAAGISWQIQFAGDLDLSLDVDAYDVDGFETSAAQVGQIHAGGARAICYISAGSWEKFRPDKNDFPSGVLGKKLDGWPGERWLDVRKLRKLMPIMTARMQDQCVAKGFDAVDFDNVDGYQNRTGFPLSYADQLAYNTALADRAHELGLAAALKNDLGQIPGLVAKFDLAVNEECFDYNECSALAPFIDARKPVLQIEYDLPAKRFCPDALSRGFSSLKKRLKLDAFRKAC